MTILIQQKSDNDCVLASIAMALGFNTWEEAWTQEDLEKVIKDKGISDFDPWLHRHHLKPHHDYLELSVRNVSQDILVSLLWKRKALITINSLNNKYGCHMVYWDGDNIHDPQFGKLDKIHAKYLESVNIRRVVLLK